MEIVYTGELDRRMMKEVIGKTIADLLAHDEKIVYLDADLMSCVGTAALPAQYDRAINCGIAEANMIGIACGLSAQGFRPIVHTFGPFASRRCYDQVFLSGGYAGNSVTVIGTDPGICAAFNGGTHMPFEDMALYRVLPDAIVVDVTDAVMLEFCLRNFPCMKGVKYVRSPRKEMARVYPEGTAFRVGKGEVLREGRDAAIVACGIMVHEALQAAQQLEQEGINAAVLDPFTVKPLDTALIQTYADKTGVVVTAENHNRIGGLYSAVRESLHGTARFGYVAVEDECGEVGPQDYLRSRFGLTAEHIAQTVRNCLAENQ